MGAGELAVNCLQRKSCAALAALAVVICAGSAHSLTIELNPPSSLGSTSFVTINAVALACCPSGQITDELQPTNLPYQETHVVEIRTERNETSYALDHSRFQITLDYARGRRSSVYSSGLIYFAVSDDVDFDFSGDLAVAGDVRGRGLAASLQDLVSGAFLFEDSLVDVPEFEIRASGSLIAGRSYRFRYNVQTGNNEANDLGATAQGSLVLTFVPGPSTGVLIAASLLLLVASNAWKPLPRR